MKFFTEKIYTLTDLPSLKKQYRNFAGVLHPDHGGKDEDFISMMNEYDIICEELSVNRKYEATDTREKTTTKTTTKTPAEKPSESTKEKQTYNMYDDDGFDDLNTPYEGSWPAYSHGYSLGDIMNGIVPDWVPSWLEGTYKFLLFFVILFVLFIIPMIFFRFFGIWGVWLGFNISMIISCLYNRKLAGFIILILIHGAFNDPKNMEADNLIRTVVFWFIVFLVLGAKELPSSRD